MSSPSLLVSKSEDKAIFFMVTVDKKYITVLFLVFIISILNINQNINNAFEMNHSGK